MKPLKKKWSIFKTNLLEHWDEIKNTKNGILYSVYVKGRKLSRYNTIKKLFCRRMVKLLCKTIPEIHTMDSRKIFCLFLLQKEKIHNFCILLFCKYHIWYTLVVSSNSSFYYKIIPNNNKIMKEKTLVFRELIWSIYYFSQDGKISKLNRNSVGKYCPSYINKIRKKIK